MTAQTADIRVTGMTCASCVGRVERMLSAVPGVEKVAVNLATETARVEAAPETLPTIAATLDKGGYPVARRTTVLEISEMTCASCVGRVERALAAVPGVHAATVNLATETATIDHDDISGLPARLMAAAAAAGYPARLRRDTSRSDRSAEKDAEADRLRRDTLLAAALTLPVFVGEMGGHAIPAFHHWIMATIGQTTSWTLQFLLTALVLAGPGRRFYRIGIPALLRGGPDMNSLVALGTAAAFGFSSVVLFAPGLLPPTARAVYFEAAAVIVTLVLLGRWLEARARGRTGAAISRLVGLQPRSARVERDGTLLDLDIAAIVPGDILHLRPGERIAVDGEVTAGASAVDESMITGEPLPVAKSAGSPVTGGTINGTGALTYRATRVGEDMVLSRIIRLVEEAQAAKLPIQALVDRITLWFVPAVMAAALVTVAVWFALTQDPARALVAGVSVLIIACPCAMGLATPTSIMVGTGRAAEMGVLFRRGDALQALSQAQIAAFDKTGTLTEGRPDLTDLIPMDDIDADTLLAEVAAVEAKSEHPLAAAITRAAAAKGLTLPDVTDFAAKPGRGVTATVDGHQLMIGSDRFLTEEGIDPAPLAPRARALADLGRTPIHIARDGRLAAVLAVADRLKPGTAGAIEALHALGLRVAMITGDNATTARAIAAELKIDDVVAEVLPEGKSAAIARLQEGGQRVAFTGDGINDAPALAAADIGIAVGTGTDVAIESADVVLMSGDLRAVVAAHRVSRATLRNIRQNLFWAFAYNTALIPVAAGVLYPATGLLLSPALAAGAMAMSSVFVLWNALRLRRLPAPEVTP